MKRTKELLNKNNLIFAIVLIIYKILLDFIYIKYISTYYFYYGFRYSANILSVVSMWAVWIFTIVLVLLLPRNNRISNIITITLVLLHFAPMNTFCANNGVDIEFALTYIFTSIILMLAQILCPQIELDIKTKVHIPGWFLWVLFVGTLLFVVFISWKYSNFRLFGINDSVYDIRSQAEKVSMPGIFRYAWSNIIYVLAFFIIVAFMKKQYWMLPIIVVEGYLVFSFAAHKSLLVILVMVFIGCLLWRDDHMFLIPIGFLVDASICIYEFVILGEEKISNLIVRRLLFDQCIIPYDCYEFFSEYPMDFFRQRFMKLFGNYSVYTEDIERIIGERVFSSGCNANSGFLSDIFTNIGVAGVVLIPVIIILTLRVLDYSTRGIETKYLFGFAVYFAMMIVETSFGSLLLSHGLAVTSILFLLIPKEERISVGKE